jgi:hypothetical protein
MPLRNWLSDLLGVLYVWVNGVQQPQSNGLEFLGGVTSTYDPVTNRNKVTLSASAGDVTGPGVSVADNLVSFNGTTGKTIKDSGVATGSLSQVVISPTAISTNQNNYSPTGWSSARYVRLNVTGACSITGFSATATQLYKTLIHVGALETPLGLLEESLSSTAANRIMTPTPNDVYMLKNWTQDIWYDATDARWRLV